MGTHKEGDKLPLLDDLPQTTASHFVKDKDGKPHVTIASDGTKIRHIKRAKEKDIDVDLVGMFSTIISKKIFRRQKFTVRINEINDTHIDQGTNRGFFGTGEDSVFCLDAIESGWKIKQMPSLKLIHISTKEELKLIDRYR
jgi:GT2 family glycosyltransferase